MDFSKSDSHSAIETLARQIFRDQVDDDYQRVNDTTEADYDRSLWTVLAEAGLLGAGVAENWGGSGCATTAEFEPRARLAYSYQNPFGGQSCHTATLL